MLKNFTGLSQITYFQGEKERGYFSFDFKIQDFQNISLFQCLECVISTWLGVNELFMFSIVN